MLDNEAARLNIQLENESYDVRFRELIQKASHDAKVVLLIDEYDKPIIDYLDNLPTAKENRQILKNFYSVLKDSDPYLELVFITGVSRFSKTSIFSDLNNLTNLTLHRKAVTLLGITQEELDLHFSEELERLAAETANSVAELKAQIQYWYNGYSWNGKAKVYNPFSLFSYFDAERFDNFWFETGTPTFLVKAMREQQFYSIEKLEVSDAVLDSYEIEQ